MGGPDGGRGAVQSIVDDDGHYSAIRSIVAGRDSVRRGRSSGYDHYHYLDIGQINAASGDGAQPPADQGGGDEAARPRDDEGLDPSVLAVVRQPQRPDEEAAASTQQTTDEIEMSRPTRDQQNTVSRGI